MVASTSIKWPKLVQEEYTYFDKDKVCMRAAEFNKIFAFSEPLIADYPPCFFAGDLSKADYCLLGINPGYKEDDNKIERRIYDEKGWEKTYLTFFEWFRELNIRSPYCSRFAVFLAGVVGNGFPQDRDTRYKLLAEHLVNVDLIPYHSVGIGLNINSAERQELVRPYIPTFCGLIKQCDPKAVFINGACFRSILEEQPLESIKFTRKSTVAVNKRLNAHIGKFIGFNAVWFDRFLTGKSAGASNEELYEAGRKISQILK